MKKIFIYILTCGIVFSASAGGKDKPDTDDDKIKSSEVLSPMKIRKRAARPNLPGTFVIEVGVNMLQNAPATLETNLIGSRTANFYFFYDMPIGNSNFVFMPGIGLGLNRFKFDNDITLAHGVDADGNAAVLVQELDPAADVQKSMLVSNYVDIPLEFRFYANPDNKKGSFHVTVGGRAGVKFTSHTKLKYELDGENIKTKIKRDFGLNQFRYGVTGRIGVGGFNMFYYHGLSEVFDEGPANTVDTSNVTVGLSFTGF